MNPDFDRALRSARRKTIRTSLDVERSTPRTILTMTLLLITVLVFWTFTAMRASAFEYLEIPENCQVIDELNPFPDISDWSLVEERDMGVMEDNSIRMCRRKTFIQDDSNRRLFVVYFKGEPELYWYNIPETSEEAKSDSIGDMFAKDEPDDPHKASDYREQSKQNFDMGFGFLKF